MAEDFEIQLNGETRKVARRVSIENFLEDLGIKGSRVAVEVNREIVKRENWPTTMIQPGDALEIVHFVGGGSWER
jgi:thiamine biosynthesis protein ThiS